MEKVTLISKLKFKGKWREYQKRVLSEMECHFNDSKLNIVAAPGAGKTTLGIEVFRKLGNPTFILAPTITIRNQWKQRIIDNFLSQETDKDLISTDIHNIAEIMITTYQALHSLYKNPQEREIFLTELKQKKFNTLVLDEAHHLRTEWWATLNSLYEELDNEKFKTVSLTATPPYDVSPAEWNNYNSLCGPVDAEISVPELVKAGDLCPHQDLIYFSNLTKDEQQIVYDYEKQRENFFKDIDQHSDILYAVEGSAFLNNLDNNVEIIYKNTNFTISLISYLLKEDNLNVNARILSEFLGLDIEKIPTFNYKQAEILFNGIIGEFSNQFKNVPLIKSKLRQYKLINNKTVDFCAKTDFKKLYARSKNKLEAIHKITEFEYANMNNSLKEVILLDYIGKGDSEGLNILSVFNNLSELKIPCGILTGTLIVIPKNLKAALYNILSINNISAERVLTTDFKKDYLRVETYGNIDIVSVITELFEKAEINVLIGTAALLGEGWDSPCVNTLIIASIVGSFMLSNQMRGRALRIDKKNKNKTSDIWHLVSLVKDEESLDLATIEKRFNTFEGISVNENKIQSGIERLGINTKDIKLLCCKNLNEEMFEFASERNTLKKKWEQIFEKSTITEKLMAPQVYDVVLGSATQQSVLCEVKPKWSDCLNYFIENCCFSRKKQQLNIIEKGFLKLCRNLNLIKGEYEDIIVQNYNIFQKETILKNLAKVLLKTLCDLSKIKINYKNLRLNFNSEQNSQFYITLTGCSNYERNIFIKAFNEMFAINDQNRYIIKYKEKYLAIPECLSNHRKNVDVFVKYFEQVLGYCDIIYTRNPQNYKELLKAKFDILDLGSLKQSRVWI